MYVCVCVCVCLGMCWCGVQAHRHTNAKYVRLYIGCVLLKHFTFMNDVFVCSFGRLSPVPNRPFDKSTL